MMAIVKKTFQLLCLTHRYLSANGGLSGIGPLWLKTRAIWRREGIAGISRRVKKLGKKFDPHLRKPSLIALLAPKNDKSRQLSDILRQAFSAPGALVIDHQYGGGANDYRRVRVEEFLRQDISVLVATWDIFNNKLDLEAHIPGEERKILDFESPNLTDLLGQNLMNFRHILVNDLVLWSISGDKKIRGHHHALPRLLEAILAIRAKNGSRLEIAINEFYCLCPNYILLQNDQAYCGLPDEGCRECLAKSAYNIPADIDLGKWRAVWQALFDHADEVRAFSQSSLDIMRKKFKIPDNVGTVKPHVPLAAFAGGYNPPQSGPMRVGVLGNIAWHKGSGIVEELAGLLKPDESIVVIGQLNASGPTPANVKIHGAYKREELPKLFEDYGVTAALVPSIWPETFCYTVQECMQLGVPLVVFPLGAQAERVKTYTKGKIATGVSASEALAALRELDWKRKNGMPGQSS